MAYKVYTTYLSKLKESPINSMKAIIMRFPPFIDESEDTVHVPELSPTNDIFNEYKKNNDWEKFKTAFQTQIEENQETIKFLGLLMQVLDDPDGNDVILACCEKDRDTCHRSIIGDFLDFMGYEVEEL